MAAQRYGGRYSPDAKPAASGQTPPPLPPFRNRPARQVSLRSRLMYLLPLPLLFAGIGAISRGSAPEMLGELGGFAGLMLAAWLLNEGLRAEAAYAARSVARPPAIPRKLFAAGLTGISVALAGTFGLGQDLFAALAFGVVAGVAHVAAFGLDPMRRKGMEGIDPVASDRVVRAVERGEAMLRETLAAAKRIGDRPLEARIERICDQARDVFRTVEEDPRDLARARTFLNVYLLGLRDATTKFADLYGRTRDTQTRTEYESLLADLEGSFAAHRTLLLQDNRSDLDIEIEVLRERLQQDGLTVR